jgi:hypothetical protein
VTQPCKSLGSFTPEEKGWGTCLTCGRFIQVERKKMRDHTKSTGKFKIPPKKSPSEKEQQDGE